MSLKIYSIIGIFQSTFWPFVATLQYLQRTSDLSFDLSALFMLLIFLFIPSHSKSRDPLIPGFSYSLIVKAAANVIAFYFISQSFSIFFWIIFLPLNIYSDSQLYNPCRAITIPVCQCTYTRFSGVQMYNLILTLQIISGKFHYLISLGMDWWYS